ncbi:hypothetical protein ACJX0J_034105, partial [Zea mays]
MIVNTTFFVKKKEADKSSAQDSIIENSDGGEALMITSNEENDVIIGDESLFEISGIGSIQIKDEEESYFLGTLEAMGFKCSADNSVIKVFSRQPCCVKAERINNLYYLQGSTVIGTAVISIHKNDALTAFKQWKALFDSLCADHGIARHKNVWIDKPVHYSNLKIFCCPAYAHLKNALLLAILPEGKKIFK